MKHYEELVGAKGRRVFYRAERFRARELFRGQLPEVTLGRRRLGLQDLSMTGLAVLADGHEAWRGKIGQCVPVSICVNGQRLYDGDAEVSRVEPSAGGVKIGLRFRTGYADVPRIVTDYEDAILSRELADGFASDANLVSAEYQQHCVEIINLFRRYRDVLDNASHRMAEHFAHRPEAVVKPAVAQREERLIDLCEERLLPEWRKLWQRGNRLVKPIMKEPELLAATKAFTERVLTPDLVAGAMVRRCYEKPLGYPGDYQIMNYAYQWRRVGDTPYEKLVHRVVGLETGECIATRMVLMQQKIARHASLHGGPEPCRITNLGCGSAQEVANVLALDDLPAPLEFTLVDQDYEALDYAYQQTYPEVVRHRGAAKVQCLHASFNQLMRAGELFHTLPAQDMIYSLGLLDYLTPKRARTLIESLLAQVKPGGLVVVTNLRDGPGSTEWPLEFIADWTLNYRTEKDMQALIEGLEVDETSLEVDSTGCVFMVAIRKPEPGAARHVASSGRQAPVHAQAQAQAQAM